MPGHGLCRVAHASCPDAFGQLLGASLEHGIAKPAGLERADWLQVFGFQVDPDWCVIGVQAEEGGTHKHTGHALPRGAYVLECYRFSRSHPASLRGTRKSLKTIHREL